MAQIRKRGHNTFAISVYLYRDPDGKRHYHHETFYGNATEAKRKAKELEVELKKGSKGSGMSIDNLFDLWLENIKDSIYLRTYEKYAWHVKRLKELLKGLNLGTMTSLDLQQRLKTINGLAPRTRKDLFSTLRTIMRQAQAWGITSGDLSAGLRIPKVTRTERTVLNKEQLYQLLEAAKSFRHYLVLRLLAVTGMRIGEVLGLQWNCLDLEKGNVTIKQAVDVKKRTLKDTKTKTSLREIQLDRVTLNELAVFRNQLNNVSPNDLVFRSVDARPLRYHAIRNTMKRALAKAGLGHIRIHDLRHGAGSILLNEGVPLTVVANLLGQRPGTTAQVYAHSIRSGESIGRYLETDILGADKNSIT